MEMEIKAGLVCATKFCTSNSESFKAYIDYIDRDEAVRKKNLNKYDLFSGYLNYMEDDEKTIQEERKGGTEKFSALFTKTNDILSVEDKAKVKEQFEIAQNNGSNMWQTVISFDNRWLEELGLYDSTTHTLSEAKLMRAARKSIDSMLAKEGLENAIWTASFHYNTDNIHIHVATVEPIPMRSKKMYKQWERKDNGKFEFKKNEQTGKLEKIPLLDRDGNQIEKEEITGKFKNSSIKELKRVLASELSEDKELNIKLTNLLRSIVADKKEKNLLDNLHFRGVLLSLYDDLKASGETWQNWNYNRNTISYLKPKISLLSDLFIKTYHKDDFANLCSQIRNVEEIYTTVYGGTNNYFNNKIYDSKDSLYARLGNAILKELQAYDRKRTEQIKVVKSATKYFEDKKIKEGLEILEGQSNIGNTFAQNKLALIYVKGEFVDRDYEKARIYLMRSAKAGNIFAKDMLKNFTEYYPSGSEYSHCERDLQVAVSHLRRSMMQTYDSWKNMQEYEKLQLEIRKGSLEIEI